MPLFSKTQEQVPCTVEVSHRFDSLPMSPPKVLAALDK